MRRDGLGLHLIMNAYWEPLDFELPHEADREPWRRWIDTSLDSPDDIVPWEDRAGPRRTSAPTTSGRARSSSSGAGCLEPTLAQCHETGFTRCGLRRCRAPARAVAVRPSGAGAGWRRSRGRSSAPAAQPEPAKDTLGRETPRGTVLGFMSAARKGNDEILPLYLDTTLQGQAAVDLAHKLFVVLDSRLPARLNELSDRPEGSPDNPLEARRGRRRDHQHVRRPLRRRRRTGHARDIGAGLAVLARRRSRRSRTCTTEIDLVVGRSIRSATS